MTTVLAEPADLVKTEEAFCQAAQIPLNIAQAGLDTLEIAKQLTGKVDTEVLSELMTAAGANAALTGARCAVQQLICQASRLKEQYKS